MLIANVRNGVVTCRSDFGSMEAKAASPLILKRRQERMSDYGVESGLKAPAARGAHVSRQSTVPANLAPAWPLRRLRPILGLQEWLRGRSRL